MSEREGVAKGGLIGRVGTGMLEDDKQDKIQNMGPYCYSCTDSPRQLSRLCYKRSGEGVRRCVNSTGSDAPVVSTYANKHPESVRS
jgi:hypothetical protein